MTGNIENVPYHALEAWITWVKGAPGYQTRGTPLRQIWLPLPAGKKVLRAMLGGHLGSPGHLTMGAPERPPAGRRVLRTNLLLDAESFWPPALRTAFRLTRPFA